MSLSRRYRPQLFADITDQDSIKETLRKEVASGKLGHAYLFSGPRGVGKTTMARIFAKALNCTQSNNGEPCNSCAHCHEAMDGRMVDLIEMDAASHSGVDHIRETIVEHVRFAPSLGKFKVYILDEAHMLSTSAWNAMLKTLEEPPSYAIFILATTELHKVPATIISRCQRFDFKRIPHEQLAERVVSLAKQEGATLDASVVASIVKHADGCLRDAETLLDQLLALGEKHITVDIASLVIPVSRLPLAARLLSACATRELAGALTAVAKLEEQGVSLLAIFDDLIQAVRVLLLAADDAHYAASLKQGDEAERMLAELVGKYSAAELSDMALVCMERRRDAKQGVDVRFALELAMAPIALGILPHGPQIAPVVPVQSITSSSSDQNKKPPVAPMTPSSAPQAKPPAAPVSEPPSVSASVAISATPLAEGSLTLALVQRKWAPFIKAVGEKNASLTFILSISRPEAVHDSTVVIRFQYPFHRDKIVTDLKNRRVVEDCLRSIIGIAEVHLEGTIGEDAGVAEQRSQDTVTNILKAFGGQVLDEGSKA